VALVFEDADRPSMTAVRGEEAFATLNAAYVRFILDDMNVHLRDLSLMSQIAAAVPVVRLARPRSLDSLGLSVDAIAQVAAGAHSTLRKSGSA
jgi:hypothetical protein